MDEPGPLDARLIAGGRVTYCTLRGGVSNGRGEPLFHVKLTFDSPSSRSGFHNSTTRRLVRVVSIGNGQLSAW